MRILSARRILSACAVSAAAMAAVVAPSGASAELLKKCEGASIEGQGSSLQAEAQGVWTTDFNTVAKEGCKGKVTVKYTFTSSGKGFKAWNEKHEFGLGFIGTDNTVNATEKGELEAQGAGQVLTIPVLQSALAIVVNLPEGCTGSSSLGAGKLALNNPTLEGLYRGTVKKWSQLEGPENDNNVFTPAGCGGASITPIVREDGSGTTHIFKRYLSLIFNGTALSEDEKNHTWAELSEGSLSTVWPKGVVTHAKTSGNPGVLKEVAAKPGSIGYANLADAVNPANGEFSATGTKSWVELEQSKKVKSGKTTRKYAEPVKNEESNCKKTVYSNGTSAFPPPSVDSPWNEVTTEVTSKSYSLCGLTYDLVLTNYASFPGGSTAEATTVHDYLKYVLKGGQKKIKKDFYLALPKELVTESNEGLELITG